MIRAIAIIIAARDVFTGRAERICAPGKWKVWRDGPRVVLEFYNGKD
jgi:hypothetical protein